MHITVCICTYKRPGCLRRLLDELTHQETAARFSCSIVVADNDKDESAKSVVREFAATSPLPVVYCVEPEQNIALVRNRALAEAHGEFAALIDDDELPGGDWLLKLLRTCEESGADGVLGPVKPKFEQEPPAWLVRGKFCERPEHPTGMRLDWQQTRTGNVLLKTRILKGAGTPFRREFGSGGEDCDFFKRMMALGRVFVWCNEASVFEVVAPSRWKRTYLIKKAFLQGQNQKHLADLKSVAKSCIAVPLYTLCLPFLLLRGQHAFMKYLLKLLDHAGKLAALAGFRLMGEKYIAG